MQAQRLHWPGQSIEPQSAPLNPPVVLFIGIDSRKSVATPPWEDPRKPYRGLVIIQVDLAPADDPV